MGGSQPHMMTVALAHGRGRGRGRSRPLGVRPQCAQEPQHAWPRRRLLSRLSLTSRHPHFTGPARVPSCRATLAGRSARQRGSRSGRETRTTSAAWAPSAPSPAGCALRIRRLARTLWVGVGSIASRRGERPGKAQLKALHIGRRLGDCMEGGFGQGQPPSKKKAMEGLRNAIY